MLWSIVYGGKVFKASDNLLDVVTEAIACAAMGISRDELPGLNLPEYRVTVYRRMAQAAIEAVGAYPDG